eukprot:CAMPEP_0117677422 /NCGR_PEP_ID=MMETSP0804-20121206/16736_1 /TAXON_ID=1074897 /ORGANISM="Tetraselmis astigmatica, Strain CCMP880" /LENGTH=178 /DNA_ID=CAMNT_0005486703 /DNA_START=73 /DNA_END=610 /DNA_ORIENTATION=-
MTPTDGQGHQERAPALTLNLAHGTSMRPLRSFLLSCLGLLWLHGLQGEAVLCSEDEGARVCALWSEGSPSLVAPHDFPWPPSQLVRLVVVIKNSEVYADRDANAKNGKHGQVLGAESVALLQVLTHSCPLLNVGVWGDWQLPRRPGALKLRRLAATGQKARDTLSTTQNRGTAHLKRD